MEQREKISVVMATYNGERYIIEQLDSINKQTVPPDEVIIFDDCSTDRTCELIREYINKNELSDSWLLYKNKETLGYIKNFLSAIEHSSGDYIFLSDQDDIFYPRKFEVMIDCIRMHPDCCLLNAASELIDENGEKKRDVRSVSGFRRKGIKKLAFKDWLYESSFPGYSMCLTSQVRSKLQKADITNCYGHDILIGLIAIEMDGNYEIGNVLSGHRIHESNVTAGSSFRNDYKLNTRIEQKKKELHEYTLLEELIKDNRFSFEYSDAIERRRKVLKTRIESMQNRRCFSLIKLVINGREYPPKTILGDLLFLLADAIKK